MWIRQRNLVLKLHKKHPHNHWKIRVVFIQTVSIISAIFTKNLGPQGGQFSTQIGGQFSTELDTLLLFDIPSALLSDETHLLTLFVNFRISFFVDISE